MHLPDFRAAERTFQLVTQVAGRTGRGPKGGRVLVQTLSPDAPAIVAAVNHDLPGFAARNCRTAKRSATRRLPSMMRIVVRGGSERTTHALAEELARAAPQGGESQNAAGPYPRPGARADGKASRQVPLSDSAALPQRRVAAPDCPLERRRVESARRCRLDRRCGPAGHDVEGSRVRESRVKSQSHRLVPALDTLLALDLRPRLSRFRTWTDFAPRPYNLGSVSPDFHRLPPCRTERSNACWAKPASSGSAAGGSAFRWPCCSR